jgi:hypothetical protein
MYPVKAKTGLLPFATKAYRKIAIMTNVVKKYVVSTQTKDGT